MFKIFGLLMLLGMSQMVNAFTVGTQNLYHYNTQMKKRVEHLKKEQRTHGFPDIMGLQEAARWIGRTSLFDVFIASTGHTGVYQSTNDWVIMNDAVALVSRLRWKNLRSYELPDTQYFSKQSMNSGVAITDEGKEVLIINVHFSPFPKNRTRRMSQARFVLKHIADAGDLPVIVLGDLNDAYDSDVLEAFKKEGYRDVLEGQLSTYDPQTNPLIKDREFGPSRLDYILYRPDLLDVDDAGLMHNENWVSDHYGLKAKFKFKSGAKK